VYTHSDPITETNEDMQPKRESGDNIVHNISKKHYLGFGIYRNTQEQL